MKDFTIQLIPEAFQRALYNASKLNFVEHFQIFYDGYWCSQAQKPIPKNLFPASMKKIQKVTFLQKNKDIVRAVMDRVERISSATQASYEREFKELYFPEYYNPLW